MTKRMLIMLGCILVLIAGLAFGFYLHIQKLIASAPKPGAQTAKPKVGAEKSSPMSAAAPLQAEINPNTSIK